MTMHPSRWSIPLFVAAALVTAGAAARCVRAPDAPQVVMYKSASCTCCLRWGKRLTDAGFTLEVRIADDLSALFEQRGIAPDLRSCHLAIVDGYAVVGHVPIEDIERMLRERPGIAGISVAGMPPTAPGMDLPNADHVPYNVVAFERNGTTSVYARY